MPYLYNIGKPFSSSFRNGKSAFKLNQEPSDASEYIQQQKVSSMYCNSSLNCEDKIVAKNYNDLYLFEKAKKQASKSNGFAFSKQNLNMGLFTQMDLTNVNTLKRNNPSVSPTTVDPNVPIILYYTVDPSGQLFGSSPCGTYNFLNYITLRSR